MHQLFFIAQRKFFLKQKYYLCNVYTHTESPYGGRGRADIYTYLRRNCTLWFWQCKNFANSQLLVKNKATGTPHGMYCIQPSLASDIFSPIANRGRIIYLHHTWGFRRCSFRLAGQCEGLYTVERVTELAPRFYLYIL